MSALTENLKYSINSSLDFFAGRWRSFYGASLTFTIVALAMALILTLFVRLAFHADSMNGDIADMLASILMEIIAQPAYLGTANAVVELTFGLFAVLLLRADISGFRNPIRLRDVFSKENSKAVKWYCVLLVGMILLHVIFFTPPFGYRDMWNLYDPPTPLQAWLNTLVQTILLYLPMVLSLYLVLRALYPEAGPKVGKYMSAFGSAFILLVVVNSTMTTIMSLFGELVLGLIFIPFAGSLMAYAILITLLVALIAFLYLPATIVMIYPFKFRYEQIHGPISLESDPIDSLVADE